METESTSTSSDDSLFDVASRKKLKKVSFTPVHITGLSPFTLLVHGVLEKPISHQLQKLQGILA